MPGLVPGIHVFFATNKTWMAGTSPAMTRWMGLRPSAPGGLAHETVIECFRKIDRGALELVIESKQHVGG